MLETPTKFAKAKPEGSIISEVIEREQISLAEVSNLFRLEHEVAK